MLMSTFVSISALALVVMIGPAGAVAQSSTSDDVAVQAVEEPEARDVEFATLRGVEAVLMPFSELEAVKGQHIHFLDAHGGFHLAGNPENQGIGTGNWYLNGSPDGEPVHPSYHGLCVAGPITIPPVGPGGVPTLSQCP